MNRTPRYKILELCSIVLSYNRKVNLNFLRLITWSGAGGIGAEGNKETFYDDEIIYILSIILLIQVFRNNEIYNKHINYQNILNANSLIVLIKQDCLSKKLIGPKMTIHTILQFTQEKKNNT